MMLGQPPLLRDPVYPLSVWSVFLVAIQSARLWKTPQTLETAAVAGSR